MFAQYPEVAWSIDRRSSLTSGRIILAAAGRVINLAYFVEDEVDLGSIESGQLDLEIEVDEPLQLEAQELSIPARLLRQFVVGQDVRTHIGFAQMRETHSRYCIDANEFVSFDATVTGHDLFLVIDQDRIAEAELLYALGDLS